MPARRAEPLAVARPSPEAPPVMRVVEPAIFIAASRVSKRFADGCRPSAA